MSQVQPNIRAPFYTLAQTHTVCWRCRKLTVVFGVLLHPGHEVFERLTDCKFDDEDLTEEDIISANEKRWRKVESDVVYYNLTYLSPSVEAYLKLQSKNRYRMDRVNGAGVDSLMNHCEHCGVRQSERKLNRSDDSGAIDNYAFAYVTHAGPPNPIKVRTINEPFEAIGSRWIGYYGGNVIFEGEIDKLLYD